MITPEVVASSRPVSLGSARSGEVCAEGTLSSEGLACAEDVPSAEGISSAGLQKRKPFSQAANEYPNNKQSESGTYPSYTALVYWRYMTRFFFVARSLSSLASLGSRAAEVHFWPRVPDRPLPLPRREAEGFPSKEPRSQEP